MAGDPVAEVLAAITAIANPVVSRPRKALHDLPRMVDSPPAALHGHSVTRVDQQELARQVLSNTPLSAVKEVFDWIGSWGVHRFRVLDLMKDLRDLSLEQGQGEELTTIGDNVARVLYRWKTMPNTAALQALSDVLQLVFQRSGSRPIVWDVFPETAGGTVYPFVRLYLSDDPGRWHELTYGPDGFKTVLLLACALQSDRPMIVIEEPETHLDARLLDVVAGMLVKASELGKQVIITTHSPILAQELPAGTIRILSGQSFVPIPREVAENRDVLTAWLTDVLHEPRQAL